MISSSTSALPYKSVSLREFWSRWHISLSTWFRDYMPHSTRRLARRHSRDGAQSDGYLHPVGPLARGRLDLCDLGLHARVFLSIERVTGWPQRLAAKSGGMVLAWAVIMVQVLVGWVFFRAENLGQALHVLGEMFSLSGFAVTLSRTALLFLAIGVLHEIHAWYGHNPDRPAGKVAAREILAIVTMISASIFLRGPGQQFVYFQF